MNKEYYSQNLSCRVRKIGGMRVLYGEGSCFDLNEIAHDIWIALDDRKSLSEVADAIEKEYDADRDTIERDAALLIQQLAKANMLIVEHE